MCDRCHNTGMVKTPIGGMGKYRWGVCLCLLLASGCPEGSHGDYGRIQDTVDGSNRTLEKHENQRR